MLTGSIGQLQADATLSQQVAQIARLDIHDLQQVLFCQAAEDNDLVNPVEKFRPEGAVQLLQHPLPRCLGPQFLDPTAADVAGHDDDGIAEIHRAPMTIGQPPLVEQLEQRVEDLRVGLLDLVEQHHAVGPPADRLGQLAALLVPHVARWRADEPGDGVPLLVLAHINAHYRLLGVEEKFRQRPAQLRLTHPRRPQEDETADGPIGVLESSPGATDGVGDSAHRFVLTHHPLMKRHLHPQQFLHLSLQ